MLARLLALVFLSRSLSFLMDSIRWSYDKLLLVFEFLRLALDDGLLALFILRVNDSALLFLSSRKSLIRAELFLIF